MLFVGSGLVCVFLFLGSHNVEVIDPPLDAEALEAAKEVVLQAQNLAAQERMRMFLTGKVINGECRFRGGRRWYVVYRY